MADRMHAEAPQQQPSVATRAPLELPEDSLCQGIAWLLCNMDHRNRMDTLLGLYNTPVPEMPEIL